MKLVFTLCLVLAFYVGFSQNNVLKFTDYGTALPLINPAAMGLENGFGGVMLYRSRFEKTENWPSLGAFNVNSMIRDKNLGGGLTLVFDKYGPYQKMLAYLAASYKLTISEEASLFFGIQAGINYITNSNVYDPYDEEIIFTKNYSQPNFGFGLHYKGEKFYWGFSIPEFKYNWIDSQGNQVNDVISKMIKVFLYGGGRFDLSEKMKLDPYLYLGYSEFEETQFNIGTKLTYRGSIQIGAQYRTKEAYAATLRLRFLNELWVGYSFEKSTSNVDNNFNNLQEISLSFRFGKRDQAPPPDDHINSIRYF